MVAQVVERDFGKCNVCGHYGAASADHLVPVTEAPEREWDLTNLFACHAYPKGCPDCTIAAGKPVYCNSIKGGFSLERAQRKLRELTGLPIAIETRSQEQEREGRDF